MAIRCAGPHHGKSMLLIKTDVSFEVGVEVTGDPVLIGPLELGGDEPAADPLSLMIGINAKRQEIPMRFRSVLVVQSQRPIVVDAEFTGAGDANLKGEARHSRSYLAEEGHRTDARGKPASHARDFGSGVDMT